MSPRRIEMSKPPFTPSGVDGPAHRRTCRGLDFSARLTAYASRVELAVGPSARRPSQPAPRPCAMGHRVGDASQECLLGTERVVLTTKSVPTRRCSASVGLRGRRGAGRDEPCRSADEDRHAAPNALLVKILSSGHQVLHHERTFTKLRPLPTSGVVPRGAPRRAPRSRTSHHLHRQGPPGVSAGQGREPGTCVATAAAERGCRPWLSGLHCHRARGALRPQLNREPLAVNGGVIISASPRGATRAAERAP
jgi:hypothetical protein